MEGALWITTAQFTSFQGSTLLQFTIFRVPIYDISTKYKPYSTFRNNKNFVLNYTLLELSNIAA
jgi:hypothetical protein